MTSREKVETKSIISCQWRCFICHSKENLELHHCIFGSYRKLADKDGLFVALCADCHRALHDRGLFERELKATAQRAYMEDHKCTREEFRKRYGRCFD